MIYFKGHMQAYSMPYCVPFYHKCWEVAMGTIQFKDANCKNCYKCVRSCPVKAIAVKNEQARIVEEDCILCGNCLTICPQNAKSVRNDLDRVKYFLNRGEKVYASIAPSFAAAFDGVDGTSIFTALKKLGFTNIEETAIGAANVSAEYEKLMNEGMMKNIITTACPSVVFLVQKYYPELVDQLAPVVSPMIAHAKMLKTMYGPRIRVIFIGPCISKKEECNDVQYKGLVDAVITFEELESWMTLEGIEFESTGEKPGEIKNAAARYYPAPGGIIKTLGRDERKKYKCAFIDGIDRCMEALNSIKEGEISGYFLEMNSCVGGCLGGPCIKRTGGGHLKALNMLEKYIRSSSREHIRSITEDARVDLKKEYEESPRKYPVPDEREIREILNRIGKFDKSKELNCGACGYQTCREKAIAVYNNKAELYMCIPYMKERAESISNLVMNNTPNAILALNRDLCIQEVNQSARRMFGKDGDLKGKSIYDVLDCPDFEAVKDSRKDILNQKHYYEKYDMTVEQSILYIEEQHMIILIIKDITNEEKEQQKLYEVRSKTVDIAQSVIEKQMMVAQQIASLLGETTAETKVILTKLKDSILTEIGEDK